jgi:hypothetical protein
MKNLHGFRAISGHFSHFLAANRSLYCFAMPNACGTPSATRRRQRRRGACDGDFLNSAAGARNVYCDAR